jgi:hypothetical protein
VGASSQIIKKVKNCQMLVDVKISEESRDNFSSDNSREDSMSEDEVQDTTRGSLPLGVLLKSLSPTLIFEDTPTISKNSLNQPNTGLDKINMEFEAMAKAQIISVPPSEISSE